MLYLYQKYIAPKAIDPNQRRRELAVTLTILTALSFLVGIALGLLALGMRGFPVSTVIMPFISLLIFGLFSLYLFTRGGHVHNVTQVVVGVFFGITAYNLFYMGFGLASIVLMMAMLVVLVHYYYRAHFAEEALASVRSSVQSKIPASAIQVKAAEPTSEQKAKTAELYRLAEFGRLSSGLFHELVTPLTYLNLSLQKLTSISNPHFNEVKEHLDKAVETSRVIDTMIASIKKHIHAEGTNESFSINKEIREAIDILSFKADKEKVALEFASSEELRITGNTVKFHQMIMSVISNAIDAYNGKFDAERRVTIELSQKKGAAMIKVIDRGSGIPAAIIAHIFDPFFSTKFSYKGLGLGLAISKDVIEKDFHGTIKVESQVNRGSTFTIFIPLETSSVFSREQNFLIKDRLLTNN